MDSVYKLLIMIGLLTAPSQASLVTFQASPAVLKTKLSESLSMRCAVSGNQDHDVTHVASIFVTKNDGSDVASITSFDAPQALTDSGNLAVKGSVSGTRGEGEIQLTWADASLVDLGDYQCKVTAVDAKGHTVLMTSSLTLTSQEPSVDDVIESFNAKLAAQQTNMNAMNAKLLSQDAKLLAQENEITKLKSCASSIVAFEARLSQSSTTRISSGQTVIWDTVTLNEGGDYHGYSGEFHCSVPGLYIFNVHAQGKENSYVCLQLDLNNVEVGDMFKDYQSRSRDGASLSHVIRLKAGDVVKVRDTGTCGNIYLYYNLESISSANYFNGHLISAKNCNV